MPAYFAFLTVMALHVFLKEKVDVAIMEVGIGGQFDSTNLIRRPVVCGVSSLGLDHTSILGETIDKIAWHKAGIFKVLRYFTWHPHLYTQMPQHFFILSGIDLHAFFTNCGLHCVIQHHFYFDTRFLSQWFSIRQVSLYIILLKGTMESNMASL